MKNKVGVNMGGSYSIDGKIFTVCGYDPTTLNVWCETLGSNETLLFHINELRPIILTDAILRALNPCLIMISYHFDISRLDWNEYRHLIVCLDGMCAIRYNKEKFGRRGEDEIVVLNHKMKYLHEFECIYSSITDIVNYPPLKLPTGYHINNLESF